METNEGGIEREGDFIRVIKIPIQDLLGILENLYEMGTNFVDMEFFIDPDEVQSVVTISVKPEYMATPEQLEEEQRFLEDEEEDDDEDDILSKIKKNNDSPEDIISDDDIEELM